MKNRTAKVSLLVRLEVPVEIPDGTHSPCRYAEQHAMDYAKHALTDWGQLSLLKMSRGDIQIRFVEGNE